MNDLNDFLFYAIPILGLIAVMWLRTWVWRSPTSVKTFMNSGSMVTIAYMFMCWAILETAKAEMVRAIAITCLMGGAIGEIVLLWLKINELVRQLKATENDEAHLRQELKNANSREDVANDALASALRDSQKHLDELSDIKQRIQEQRRIIENMGRATVTMGLENKGGVSVRDITPGMRPLFRTDMTADQARGNITRTTPRTRHQFEDMAHAVGNKELLQEGDLITFPSGMGDAAYLFCGRDKVLGFMRENEFNGLVDTTTILATHKRGQATVTITPA